MVIIMSNNKYEVKLYYEKSIKELEKYIKTTRTRPNEKNWNRFAVKNGYLSSESIGYICGIGFNKLCREIIKRH